MKTKLLSLALCFVVLLGFSQADIEQFQSASGSQYVRVQGSINQSTSGNVSWDFTGLTDTSNIYTDTYESSIIQTKEGTTLISEMVLNTSGAVAIASERTNEFQNIYTDNGVIGTFPLSYNYLNSDMVSGTFSGSGYSGNIVNPSTIDVNVDAYGTLKIGAFDGPVTRLKIVKNLTMSVSQFFGATTSATSTSYYYYDDNSSNLIFRSTRLEISDLSLDVTLMERLYNNPLSNEKFQTIDSHIKLINNPIKDVFELSVASFIYIQEITISDVSGRVVLKETTDKSSIDVKDLNSGLFFALIKTNKGIVTKKFLKQ
ncbi:T9SS type A sorting domain-containing protein [Mariniflexile sp.]|uniref:T9SS type A sorting domain-containing protein n=1 Tax=Mariniflexile sp. TaxID=1979402 RepID=UPI00356A7713